MARILTMTHWRGYGERRSSLYPRHEPNDALLPNEETGFEKGKQNALMLSPRRKSAVYPRVHMGDATFSIYIARRNMP